MRDGSIFVLSGDDVLSLLAGRMAAIVGAVKRAHECHSNRGQQTGL
jgi:hypothetical protein